MGFIGGYYGYMFEEQDSKADHDAREIRGTVYWTLSTRRFESRNWQQINTEWSAEGYKIGLLLRTEQTILEFVYGGVALSLIQPQNNESAELARVYGLPTGYKWVVWGGSGPREYHLEGAITITFPVRVRLTPASTGPQMIPVASRHLKGSFVQSMPGLWAIGRGK